MCLNAFGRKYVIKFYGHCISKRNLHHIRNIVLNTVATF